MRLNEIIMENGFQELLACVRKPLRIVQDGRDGAFRCLLEREMDCQTEPLSDFRDVMSLPPLFPEHLGGSGFLEKHHLRFPYVAGEMAHGISTTSMVIAMARAGMLCFFGAAGLSVESVEAAITEIERDLGSADGKPTGGSWGVNLIHSPRQPQLERELVHLFLERGVRRVSASAFMNITPSLVQYACSGLQLKDGVIGRKNFLFAKISRPEVAGQFMSPAPESILQQLVREGLLTTGEAELATYVPLAEDITAEGDSGGHTDNRPLAVLLPTIVRLRDALCERYRYSAPIRIGAAGGLGCPASVAAAFALGAAYVVTGSINQSAIESGTSQVVREMLASATMADVAMAPAPDMFELGVKVQVLRRGTLFGARATKLHAIYVSHPSLEAIPSAVRAQLERDIFQAPLEDIWACVQKYWMERDPRELDRAEVQPKHRMALVFRWYLGLSSVWAQNGERSRAADYQVWCGPAVGAFNDWARGSFLEDVRQRTVVQIALNLLEGAAVLTRAHQLRSSGVPFPERAVGFRPRPLLLNVVDSP